MSKESKYYFLSESDIEKVKKLKGPIVIFGAGGFIGLNLLKTLLLYRNDVYGVSQDAKNNWRFIASNIQSENIHSCDINEYSLLRELIINLKPKTIFNLAAYGAYSKQKEYKKIYQTNFISIVDIIELLKESGFDAYVQTGSSSEYGTNSSAPKEEDELIPNSHYAVSKVANYYAAKYYGKIEKLPIVHLRLYSAYGPWEEPDRLIPVLISHARKSTLPPLVNPNISRDFIYTTDVVSALICAASSMNKNIYGEAFNIGTGIKTTMNDLVEIVKNEFTINENAEFGSMQNRDWDVADWYANIEKAKNLIRWEPKVELTRGLYEVNNWQKEINFDAAFWNR